MCKFCQNARAQLTGDEYLHTEALQDSSVKEGRTSAPWSFTAPTVADRLDAEACPVFRSNRVPVTLLTGFLGSGKTTVLNGLLRNAHGKKLAVIENEFGEVSIDDALLEEGQVSLRTAGTEVVLLPNGCLCCRSRQDLADALGKVWAASEGRLDGVLLEMSGLSEVGPVVQTFHADASVQRNFVIDGIVCLADARALAHALAENQAPPGVPPSPATAEDGKGEGAGVLSLIQEQLALADRVLLSKVDVLVSSLPHAAEDGSGEKTEEGTRLAGVARVEGFIRCVNASAPIVHCVKGEVAVEDVLNLRTLSLKRALALDPHFVNEGGSHHRHDDKEEEEGHHHHHHEGEGEKEGHAGERSVKVHTHVALRFTSVPVLIDDGPLEWAVVEKWLTDLMEGPGLGHLCRFKGVLCCTQRTPYRRSTIVTKRVIVQGVYGFLDSNTEEPWPEGEVQMVSKMVFIGTIDDALGALIRSGLLKCLAPGYVAKTRP